jgi:hypothetical protein
MVFNTPGLMTRFLIHVKAMLSAGESVIILFT